MGRITAAPARSDLSALSSSLHFGIAAMTNIVSHPALDLGRTRLLGFYRDQLCAQRDRAVQALNTALASMMALQDERCRATLAPMIDSFRTAAEAFARIDPLAPPDALLLARMTEALDRLAQLTLNSGIF